MKTFPDLKEPSLCNNEAEHLVIQMNQAFDWVKTHRASAHPNDPPLRRVIMLCDFGPEWQQLIAVAGDEPPSPQYFADCLAAAWNQVRKHCDPPPTAAN